MSANAVIAGRAGRVSCVSGGQGSNFVSAGGPEPRGKMKIAQTLRSWSFELINSPRSGYLYPEREAYFLVQVLQE